MKLASIFAAAKRKFAEVTPARVGIALAAAISFGAPVQANQNMADPQQLPRLSDVLTTDIVVTAPSRDCLTEPAVFSAVPASYRNADLPAILSADKLLENARLPHVRMADYQVWQENLRSRTPLHTQARQAVMARVLLDVSHDFRAAYGIEPSVTYLSALKQIESGMGDNNFRPGDIKRGFDRRISRALGPSQIQLGFFKGHWEESWDALRTMTRDNGMMQTHPLYAQLLAKADPTTGALSYKSLTNLEKNQLRLDPYFASIMSLAGVMRRAGVNMSTLRELNEVAKSNDTITPFQPASVQQPCANQRAVMAEQLQEVIQGNMHSADFWGRAYAGHQLGEGGLRMIERSENGAARYRARYPANVSGNAAFWRGVRTSSQLLDNFERRIVTASNQTAPVLAQARPAYAAASSPFMLAAANDDGLFMVDQRREALLTAAQDMPVITPLQASFNGPRGFGDNGDFSVASRIEPPYVAKRRVNGFTF